MKNKGDNAIKSVETKNGIGNGHKANVADRKIRVEPKMSISEYLVDGGFPHFLALPSDFQMKGQKLKLFSRQSVTLNKLYRSSSLDSSGTDQSGYSDQSYEQSSSTRNDIRYQAARSLYYPDKFHVLKQQIQILHQVINNRGKRIDSLNDVINSLQEQRQQFENGST